MTVLVARRALEDCHILVGKASDRNANVGEQFCWPESFTPLPPLERSFNAVEITFVYILSLFTINIFKSYSRMEERIFSFPSRIPFHAWLDRKWKEEKKCYCLVQGGRERKREGRGPIGREFRERAHLPRLGARPFAPTHMPLQQYLDGNAIVI